MGNPGLVDFIMLCIDIALLQSIISLFSIDEIVESTKWLGNRSRSFKFA